MPGTDHAANCHSEESPMGQSDGGFPLENGKRKHSLNTSDEQR